MLKFFKKEEQPQIRYDPERDIIVNYGASLRSRAQWMKALAKVLPPDLSKRKADKACAETSPVLVDEDD